VKIDVKLFEGWLLSKEPGELVGNVQYVSGCPIFNWLTDAGYSSVDAVSQTEVFFDWSEIDADGQRVPLPRTLKEWHYEVDHLRNADLGCSSDPNITREMALAALYRVWLAEALDR